jgi:hypothetical protein
MQSFLTSPHHKEQNMQKDNLNVKKWFAIGMTAIAILATSSMSLAADQDFTLVNKTGYEIDQVYVSPASAKNWHNDVLGQDTLVDGNFVKITFAPENEICKYDIKVVYSDKDEAEWGNIDLCKEEKITIHWDKKSNESTATFE